METLRLQAQHLDLLLNMIAMMGFYCVDQRTELVSLMDHGLDHYQSVSVSYAVECFTEFITLTYRNYGNI